MKKRTLFALCLGLVWIVSCGKEVPWKKPVGFSMYVSTGEGESASVEHVFFQAKEMRLCNLGPNEGGKTVPMLTIHFARLGDESTTETAGIYLDYDPKEGETAATGDLWFSRPQLDASPDYDSWQNGQNRDDCKVRYTRAGDNILGTFDCPLSDRESKGKAHATGEFHCPVKPLQN